MLPVTTAGRPHVRALGAGMLGAIGTVAIIGIPTDVVSNPWFGRETPVRGFDVVVLIALSVLAGALLATYALAATPASGPRRFGISAGVLGWFAISCPACNTIVVGLLGASGATSVFAPMQPALGAAAVSLAAGALLVRLRAIRRGRCPVPTPTLQSGSAADSG
jgi:hypothetical protein